MSKSKKAVTPTADLPIIETPVKARKPRASRSKAAVAERAVQAVEAAQATGDYSKLSDAKVELAANAIDKLAESVTVSGVDTPAPDFVTPSGIDFDAVMARLTAVEHGWTPEPVSDHPLTEVSPPHPATDTEIDAAVAALEAPVDQDDPEVVRFLADVDFGSMYQVEETAPEEAALARLKGTGAFMPGTHTWAIRPPLVPILYEFVDLLIASGRWTPPASGDHYDLVKYWPSIKQILTDSLNDKTALSEKALIDCIPHEFGKLIQVPFGSVVQLPATDDTYTTLTDQHDKILALEGELIDAKAEVQRAEIVARAALRDVTEKGSIIEHQDKVIADLSRQVAKAKAQFAYEENSHSRTIDQRDEYHDWADKLANAIGGDAVGEHSSANNPWENAVWIANDLKTDLAAERERVAHLTKSNMHLASRGFWARVFNQVI